MKTKEELDLLKLTAEVRNLIASRRKLTAERQNLLAPHEARFLQRLQPFLGGLAIVASLTFAFVTWWNKHLELSAKDVDLATARQQVIEAQTRQTAALLSADQAEKRQTLAEKGEQEAESKKHQAEQQADEANKLVSKLTKETEEAQATLPALTAQQEALKADIRAFGNEPHSWASEIRDAATPPLKARELATRIQQWFVDRNAELQPPPSTADPLAELRSTLTPAADALFNLRPKKWSTPEFFALLRLCQKDRRYVGLLADYALNHKDNEPGWLYTTLVFRNITYEDTENDKKRFDEYVQQLIPFLNEALQHGPEIRTHAETIFTFLPRQYRQKK